jgi:hypothetical protein
MGRSHTFQGKAQTNFNTIQINPNTSFITEDHEVKDLDEENGEPFAE